MFFLLSNGLTLYLAIFLALAVGPAVALVRYVYNLDALEREPAGLLLAFFWRGVIAALVASVLEQVGMEAFGLLSGLGRQDPWFLLLSDFAVVGVIEEACKYVLMARATWHDPNFDCRYDGVVYAVATSLGFAAAENVTYGLAYGPGVLLGRAMMADPGAHGLRRRVRLPVRGGKAPLRSRAPHWRGAVRCLRIPALRAVARAVRLHRDALWQRRRHVSAGGRSYLPDRVPGCPHDGQVRPPLPVLAPRPRYGMASHVSAFLTCAPSASKSPSARSTTKRRSRGMPSSSPTLERCREKLDL